VTAPVSERLDAELPDPALHLEFVSRQFADPAVAPWHFPEVEGGSGGARTGAQAERMIVHWARQQRDRGYTWWPWRERSSGELVAMVGLNDAEVEGEPVVEVGWSVAPARWGEGLAVEAAGASLEWGFGQCALKRIVSFTMVDNHRSRRVMKKLGMTFEREFARQGLPHVLYTLSA
jgi:RimJ/RimL family protein N-acetyltransferase